MKESTGELSMVVITIIAVIAVLGIWNLVKGPITDWVTGKFNTLEKADQNCPKGTKYNKKTGVCE